MFTMVLKENYNANEYINQRLHLLKVASIVLHALCSSLFDVHDGSCVRREVQRIPPAMITRAVMNIKVRAAK